MPYTVYFQYEYRVSVDADSIEEAIQKAYDVPLDAHDLIYLDTFDIEQWDDVHPSKWKHYELGKEVE